MSEPTIIERIMDPNSVAIVGASKDETKRGYQAIETLQGSGYDGDIYPVNPNSDEIRGLKVYPAVSEIPERVDIALIVTPARIVPSVLKDCAGTDLAGAVVIGVGFGEAGEGGEALEREIVSLANEHDIRLVGPNTSGMINVHAGLNLVGAETVPEGGLGLLCQSGNMAISLFTEAATRDGVGYSYYIGVGNEADLRFDEYLPYLNQDPETVAIVLYVEGMREGRAFLQAARDITPEMPIVALKSGRSPVGKQSASSHTGALAGDSEVAKDVFKQAGVITVDRSDELLAVANSLSSLPDADGSNVGILADGGGHATLAADALSEHDLSVPELTVGTQECLDEVLPDAASVVNPVDVAGGTDDNQRIFYDCAEAMIADPNVDALMLVGLFGGYGIRFSEEYTAVECEVAADLASLVDDSDIPIVVQSAYAGFGTEPHGILRESGIPVVESIDVATASLEALVTYGRHLAIGDRKGDFRLGNSTDNTTLVQDALRAGDTQLSEYRAKWALHNSGLPVVPFELAESREEAITAADRINGTVVMKVISPDIVHKSEAGAVALEIEHDDVGDTYEALLAAAREYMPRATIEGILVSPMRTDTTELIIGVVNDEQFGKVLMLGIGGIFVEVLEDVTFRALPVSDTDAREMLEGIDAQEILDGTRGGPTVDRQAIIDLLLDVSAFVRSNPAIDELDLNPVFATDDGVEIADAAVTLHNETQMPETTTIPEVDGD
ncbi:acetate--CoA ligase family protein [Halorubrum sp. DTA98]|uniref:acetate--CoA ligase family protein n=1 Tax=Halorubrum sp. DTA98 TaxID=3402163 RepID=UPI003AAD06AB